MSADIEITRVTSAEVFAFHPAGWGSGIRFFVYFWVQGVQGVIPKH